VFLLTIPFSSSAYTKQNGDVATKAAAYFTRVAKFYYNKKGWYERSTRGSDTNFENEKSINPNGKRRLGRPTADGRVMLK
jgi:hypothetical protein